VNKKVFGRKLSRNRNSRKALYRSLVRALVLSGQIKTTQAKARAVQPEIDKIMTLVKKGDLASQKRILSKLGNDKEVYKTLYEKHALLIKDRNSGFTRLMALPERRGDNAKMVSLSFVEVSQPKPVNKAKKETKTKK